MTLIKPSILLLFIALLTACNSQLLSPKIKQENQTVEKVFTKQHFKIVDFKNMIDKDANIKPIYIYIDNSLNSEISANMLPRINKLTSSLLVSFGQKVQVITSLTQKNLYLNNPQTINQVYVLDGGITAYDKDIISESSSTRVSIYIGDDKNKNKYKNKNKTSQLIGDFYLKKQDIIVFKTSSSIKINETTKGYSFGINTGGLSLSLSGYKSLKDGLDLSIRKIVEASLIDLLGHCMNIPIYQIMPELQTKKTLKQQDHLSNYDFCSDIDKIILYPLALKNDKFNMFGMSHQSELNKLKCLKKLYSDSMQYKIRLNTVYGELTDRTDSYKNVRFIQEKITSISKIKRANTLTNSIHNERICDKPENIDYCRFIENRVELEKVLKYN